MKKKIYLFILSIHSRIKTINNRIHAFKKKSSSKIFQNINGPFGRYVYVVMLMNKCVCVCGFHYKPREKDLFPRIEMKWTHRRTHTHTHKNH